MYASRKTQSSAQRKSPLQAQVSASRRLAQSLTNDREQ